jgi:predicted nucleic acid-binding protein
MNIELSPNFLQTIKGKWLLLDTCVFIDTSLNPSSFLSLFNDLKTNGVTLLTIKPVLMEFVEGAADPIRFKEKSQIIDNIIEAYLPITEEIFEESLNLIKDYGPDGKGLGVTDFLLGALLKKFKGNLFLFSKNTNDFLTNIFPVVSTANMIYRKGIHTYGVYSFS